MATLSGQQFEPSQPVQAVPTQLGVHCALIMVQVLFGAGSVVAKVGLPEMNPLLFVLLRDLIATPCFVIQARIVDGPFTYKYQDFPVLASTAVAMVGAHSWYLIGLKLTNPVVAAAWQPSQPIFVLALAVLLRLELFTVPKGVGVFCALLGGFVMSAGASHSGGGKFDDFGSNTVGNFLLLCNCLMMSIFILSMRGIAKHMRPATALAAMYPIATLVELALVLAASSFHDVRELLCADCGNGFWYASFSALPALVYWGLGCSFLGGMCLSFGAKHAKDATYCLAYTALQPVVAGTLEAVLVRCGWNDAHPTNLLKLPSSLQVGGACIIVLGITSIIFDAVTASARAQVIQETNDFPAAQRKLVERDGFYSELSTECESTAEMPMSDIVTYECEFEDLA